MARLGGGRRAAGPHVPQREHRTTPSDPLSGRGPLNLAASSRRRPRAAARRIQRRDAQGDPAGGRGCRRRPALTAGDHDWRRPTGCVVVDVPHLD